MPLWLFLLYDVTSFTQKGHSIPVATYCNYGSAWKAHGRSGQNANREEEEIFPKKSIIFPANIFRLPFQL